jgi:hypothetical protein
MPTFRPTGLLPVCRQTEHLALETEMELSSKNQKACVLMAKRREFHATEHSLHILG